MRSDSYYRCCMLQAQTTIFLAWNKAKTKKNQQVNKSRRLWFPKNIWKWHLAKSKPTAAPVQQVNTIHLLSFFPSFVVPLTGRGFFFPATFWQQVDKALCKINGTEQLQSWLMDYFSISVCHCEGMLKLAGGYGRVDLNQKILITTISHFTLYMWRQ